MKVQLKIIIALVLFMVVFFSMPFKASAQIQLRDNGNVGVGSTSLLNAKMRIYCWDGSNTTCNPTSWSVHGLYVYTNANSGNTVARGITGLAHGSSVQQENVGVFGEAFNAPFSAGIMGNTSGSGPNDNRWAGYFSGDITAANLDKTSDGRLKKNISSLNRSETLNGILQLEPRRFQFKNSDELEQEGLPSFNSYEGERFGLIAQELEEIFPELVRDIINPHISRNNEADNDEYYYTNTKTIHYSGLIPVLISGLQEQQGYIEALEVRIEQLEQRLQD